MEFLWFKLFISASIMTFFTLIIMSVVFYFVADDQLVMYYMTWIPVWLIYAEVYMTPCCILEIHFGHRHNGNTVSLIIKVLTWIWGALFLTAGILSTLGVGLNITTFHFQAVNAQQDRLLQWSSSLAALWEQ